MPITALSTPNIAFIKYWGNRNAGLRLPSADSLSMTLDSPSVEMTIEHANEMSVQSFEGDGSERILKEKELQRFEKHLSLVKKYLEILGAPDAIPNFIRLEVQSRIPSAIGLASSAAVFSCLARAYEGLIADAIKLNDTQVSVIARLGSGSAARSVMGGFVTLQNVSGDGIDSAVAIQIADENHWPLHDIVIAPSLKEKEHGSTEGHSFAPTSPFFAARLKEMPRRQRDCIDAILQKDFEKLQAVTEEDALDMHHVMETSNPPLHYLTEETHRIRQEIENLRTSQHLEVLYTMDAGPTVHLICTEAARPLILEFAHAQKGCTVFETKVGRGARLL